MKAYVFPGQASQFPGMGKDLYDSSLSVKNLMENANDILGYRLTDVMFDGTAEDLKATKITQPAVFLHSLAKVEAAGADFQPDVLAGHSLGEFSALVAGKSISFEDGLQLVQERALAMQEACDMAESTMAAIIGLDDEQVDAACKASGETVVAANFNCPGQVVISGSVPGIESVVEQLKEAGAKRAIILPVSGAFHSPFMQPAKERLEAAIQKTNIVQPLCPVYQNVTAKGETNPEQIRQNLIDQLTSSVRWTQTMRQMIADGVTVFIEAGGNGKTLQGFVKKVDRRFPTEAL